MFHWCTKGCTLYFGIGKAISCVVVTSGHTGYLPPFQQTAHSNRVFRLWLAFSNRFCLSLLPLSFFSSQKIKASLYICIILVSNGIWYLKISLSYFMCRTRQTVEMEVSLLVYRDTENMCSVTDSFLQGKPNSKNVWFTYFEDMGSVDVFFL